MHRKCMFGLLSAGHILNPLFHVFTDPFTEVCDIMSTKLTLQDFSPSELPCISVIVPVFNSAHFLDETFRTIATQTYTNLEILLVDDGSRDESTELVDSYSRADDRCRTIHALTSRGVSAARNAGVQAARGTWICWADSDDVLPPKAIEHLFLAVMKHDTKMAMGSYKECHMTPPRLVRPIPVHPMVCNNARDLQKYFLTYGANLNHMWTKIFHRSVFENVRFPVGMIYEDIYIMPQLLENAGSGAMFNKCVYRYQVRKNSTSTHVNIRRQMDGIYARQETVRYMEQHYPEFVGLANDTLLPLGSNVLGRIAHIGGREKAPEEWDETVRLMEQALENCALRDIVSKAEAMAMKRDPAFLSRMAHFLLRADRMI